MVFDCDISVCCLEVPWVSGFDQSFESCRCQKNVCRGQPSVLEKVSRCCDDDEVLLNVLRCQLTY